VKVLIPVNALDRAKGRLADVLGPEDRARLAIATVRTVIDAVRAAGCEALVLTRDRRIRTEVEERARVIEEDPAAIGLNAQLESALARLAAGGVLDEILVLHADLPLASEVGIRAVLAAAPPALSATLVRSSDGGTNAMLLRPPGRFPLAYGADSFGRHAAAARAAGMAVVEVDAPSLALDLDTAADIERLMSVPGGRESAAGRLLEGLGFGQAAGAR
jgi:2-phospho-L-lactate guanylyltransferase